VLPVSAALQSQHDTATLRGTSPRIATPSTDAAAERILVRINVLAILLSQIGKPLRILDATKKPLVLCTKRLLSSYKNLCWLPLRPLRYFFVE
jgi:hypothetical protein